MIELPILNQPSGDSEPGEARTSGPMLWRHLEEYARGGAGTGPDAGEFTDPSIEILDDASRRDFLRFMGASLALGGVSGCAYQPPEAIVPYVQAPEALATGKPIYFASALSHMGYATGVLVKSAMGRPIKVEGNPDHPASLGATDLFAQAAMLGLYDPERSQTLLHMGRIEIWERLQTALLDTRERMVAKKGAGLRFLTQTVASATLSSQLANILKMFPEAKWHAYESVSRDAVRAGSSLAFGEVYESLHHVEKANVIAAFDSDFLVSGGGRLKDARAFADRRDVDAAGAAPEMNRLYVFECTASVTGGSADHRSPVASDDVAFLVQKLAGLVGVSGYPAEVEFPPHLTQAGRILKAVAKDLKAHVGKSLILIGDSQPAEIHALGHLINHKLGNFGQTIELLPRIDAGPVNQGASIAELVKDINAGLVETLVILGGNPAYDAPSDLGFAGALASDRVKQRVHLGLYLDETAVLCHWHIPEAHPLESWGDPLAFDGTATIQQPMIAPLFKGKTAHEVVALFLGDPSKPSLDLIREYWRNRLKAADFETLWKVSLRDGVIAGTAHKPVTVAPRSVPPSSSATVGKDVLELVFRPDPTVWDGRYANNGWLQELPKPLTNLTWGNAVLIAPALAMKLGLKHEVEGVVDMVELTVDGHSLRMPVLIAPGQAERTLTVHLGHGRKNAGKVGDGVGFDVGVLRTSAHPWAVSGVRIGKTSDEYKLALTHAHYNMVGRGMVQTATLAEYRKTPDFAQEKEHEPGHGATLFPDPETRLRHEENREGNSWGMAINLNACIGCNACVVACQSENNIPVVGRQQVLASREMHWLRIDRYFEVEHDGPPTVDLKLDDPRINDPKIHFQPVPCMQCEKAPCELVCPVGATTHSVEGLNEMTYNRCVGTRYCSNNCPYKVRRFNFFHYASNDSYPTLKLMQNPDVTVRTRGVMEKCTYCVQRISKARIESEIAGKPRVGGDEVVTACQGVCPTKAIVFGNLNDPAASVNKAKASPRNYAMLAELNTRPRTTYLAKLTNPNPEIEATAPDASSRA